MLVLTRKPNQSIQIGENITVNIVKVRGNTIQIGIEAPKDIAIVRTELLEREENASRDADTHADEIDAEVTRELPSNAPLSIIKLPSFGTAI